MGCVEKSTPHIEYFCKSAPGRQGGVYTATKSNISSPTYFRKIAYKPHHRHTNQRVIGWRLPPSNATQMGVASATYIGIYMTAVVFQMHAGDAITADTVVT